ncbi:MAG: hypothetical protein ACRD5E_07990 [Nitrososphaeraceae archaeon]
MHSKYVAIVAVIAATLIGATAFATTDSAFAGGHGHKKHYDKNQVISQANDCGNGLAPLNVGCQNLGSQVQGEENAVSLAADQTFPPVNLDGGK